jgi:hypothetical protein
MHQSAHRRNLRKRCPWARWSGRDPLADDGSDAPAQIHTGLTTQCQTPNIGGSRSTSGRCCGEAKEYRVLETPAPCLAPQPTADSLLPDWEGQALLVTFAVRPRAELQPLSYLSTSNKYELMYQEPVFAEIADGAANNVSVAPQLPVRNATVSTTQSCALLTSQGAQWSLATSRSHLPVAS